MAVLAQDLRDAVLQAAISGKLTEHSDKDTPIKITISKMLKNREKLYELKKAKPTKATDELDYAELFEIPVYWEWVKLQDIGTLTRGKGIKKNEIVDKGKPCIRYGQLYTTYKNKFTKAVSYITEGVFNISNKAYRNDILMALTGENNFDIALAVSYLGNEEIAVGGDLTVLSHHYMNPLYLTMVINSPYGISCKQKMAKGNIIVHISNDKLASIFIPIPPIEEQARIVEKVEELMQKIDEYEKIENRLEEIKKQFPIDLKDSLLQAAMQGKLTEQLDTDSSVDDLIEQIKIERQKLEAEGKIKKSKSKKTQQNDYFIEIEEDDLPFKIPFTWKFVNLKSISYTNGGYAFKSTDYTSEGIRIIRISDFNNNGILNEEIVRCPYNEALEPFKIKQNDILMCMTGGTVGKCCIVKSIVEYMATNQRVANISSLGIDANFLYFAIKSPFIQRIIQNNKTSTNDNISMDLILSFPIPLPPLEEQEHIVKVLNDLLPLCEAL